MQEDLDFEILNVRPLPILYPAVRDVSLLCMFRTFEMSHPRSMFESSE